jgi:hypothetical protein
MDETRLHQVLVQGNGFGFFFRVPDADDFFPFDEDEPAFVPLRQEPGRFPTVAGPLAVQRAIRSCIGEF